MNRVLAFRCHRGIGAGTRQRSRRPLGPARLSARGVGRPLRPAHPREVGDDREPGRFGGVSARDGGRLGAPPARRQKVRVRGIAAQRAQCRGAPLPLRESQVCPGYS